MGTHRWLTLASGALFPTPVLAGSGSAGPLKSSWDWRLSPKAPRQRLAVYAMARKPVDIGECWPDSLLLRPLSSLSYSPLMKTVIFIRDEILEAAERTARALGMSRSELFATAVSDFLERHSRENVTERLNAVYADDHGASAFDEGLQALQAASLPCEDTW